MSGLPPNAPFTQYIQPYGAVPTVPTIINPYTQQPLVQQYAFQQQPTLQYTQPVVQQQQPAAAPPPQPYAQPAAQQPYVQHQQQYGQPQQSQYNQYQQQYPQQNQYDTGRQSQQPLGQHDQSQRYNNYEQPKERQQYNQYDQQSNQRQQFTEPKQPPPRQYNDQNQRRSRDESRWSDNRGPPSRDSSTSSTSRPPSLSQIHERQQNSTPSFEKETHVNADFGDMGAAVRKYGESDPTKQSNSGRSEGDDGSSDFPTAVDNHPYRQAHSLSVWDNYNKNAPIPEPYERFEDFQGISQTQLNAFYKSGFTAPMPIQAQTWPIALNSRDVVSIAKTGSGKTLAFLLPAYRKISEYRLRNEVISVLVLAPTRELATQIQEEAEKFGSIAGFYSTCAYGGAPKAGQLKAINSGISVLVATPGRLNDFLDSNQVDISRVFYFVLDEADRMLDMGFEPQIRDIVRRLPRQRQTLMFSATWPQEVRRLAHDFLQKPIHIRLGGLEKGLRANESIEQNIILLRSGEEKDNELVNLIRSRYNRNGHLVLIFVARKNTCDFVTNMLNRMGIRAAAMHGDRDQKHRERTLAAFRDGACPILVATDVASRGLDVKGVSGVINYDLANSTEDYVHRIGRTGRAGMSGESFTFVTHSHEDIWKTMGLVEVMAKTGQYPPPEVQDMIDQLKAQQERNKNRRAAENEQFQKVLIVAEKPSVAKMIAEHLSGGRFRTRRGQSRANQIFEFIKWFGPAQEKCKLMVTSVVGHIFGLGFQGRQGRDVAALFLEAKVEKVIEESTKKLRIVEHLQELGQEAEYLYLWLDCDREGENIGFEVISLTQEYIHYDNVYRARFSALTRQELCAAYDNPMKPDKYAAMSVDARQELDLRIGVAFSRLMTRSFLDMAKEKFRLKDQKVVSYGPCQTPTLWFCAQRHKEIQRFTCKPYYVVSVIANIFGQEMELYYRDEKVYNQNQLREMESLVRTQMRASVMDTQERDITVNKPIGLNTVTLLKACSKGLGMSPTAAMQAAEHLYTSGYISYPRTETTAYPPSFDLVGCLEEQANNPQWGRLVQYLLKNNRVNPPEKGHDVGDHPPITPMRSASRNEFQKNNEWRLYDYVVRHFIGSLHDDMTYTEKKLVIDVGGYQFHHTWHQVKDRGFMFAMPWRFNRMNLNEMPVRTPNSGEVIPLLNFVALEESTKPPEYLQESELIALMDKHGIGTDASIPQHIKNIQERHYVDVCGPSEDGQKGRIIPKRKFFGKGKPPPRPQQNQDKPQSRHMVPRSFGLAFLSCFENLDKELCEPSIRAYMEKQVQKIATGETDKNEVVQTNLKLFHEKFIHFRSSLDSVEKFFAPKQFDADGNQIRNNQGFGRGGFDGGRGGGRGGFDGGRGGGRGGFDGGRGGGRGGFDGGHGGSRGGFNGGRGGYDNGGSNGGFNDSRGRGRGGFDGGRGGSRGGFDGGRGGRGGFDGGRGGRGGFDSDRGRGRGGFDSGRGRGRGDDRFNNGPGRGGDFERGRGQFRGRGGGHNSNVGQKRGGSPMPYQDKRPHHGF